MGVKEEKVIAAEIVIVGAGIAGLATAVGLYRSGLRSLVLESSDDLRASGVGFTTWTNGWRALDALGIGDSLRSQHIRIQGLVTVSTELGVRTSLIPYVTKESDEHEVRGLKRKVLLETLAKELPKDSIRFSSRLVSIEDSGHFKLLHLADGSIIKAKAVIGCDGVNSAVASWLGFSKPAFAGRSAIRGYHVFEGAHGFEPTSMLFSGHGVRYGFVPLDDSSNYWFVAFRPSAKEHNEVEENPVKMKEFVLNNLGKVPDEIRNVFASTREDDIICSPLRYRHPLEILFGNVSKDNVCVVGDAFHPMTPDLGQGACSALEDAVVLARCLGEAYSGRSEADKQRTAEEAEYERIRMAFKKYAKERKWRGADLVATAHFLGTIHQSNNKAIGFIRDRILAPFLAAALIKKTRFDCGQLKTV
ncbi:hypothetical protein Droror1_Dr00005996 [Drosera rotundifolia]